MLMAAIVFIASTCSLRPLRNNPTFSTNEDTCPVDITLSEAFYITVSLLPDGL